MHDLTVVRNQIDYIGAFQRPLLSLWGDGKVILEQLYNSFEEFGVGLKDIRGESAGEDPSAQAVKVFVGSQTTYKFKFEQVEASAFDLGDADLERLPKLLEAGTGWIRTVSGEPCFRSHLVTYSAHCTLTDCTSETFLTKLNTLRLPGIGVDRGSGTIFHADVEDWNGRLRIMIDHSLLLPGGIFLELSFVSLRDILDYAGFLGQGRDWLTQTLASVGLQMSDSPNA
jgi:hypothetical protein